MSCVVVGVARVNGGVASGLCGMTMHCFFGRCSNTFLFLSSPGGAVDASDMQV